MAHLQIGRTPVKIHPLTPVALVLMFALGDAASALALIWSLALHEYAHIAFARSYGYEVGELRLTPFGGEIRVTRRMEPRAELAVTSAGPAASVIMAAAAALLSELFPGLKPALAPFFSTSLMLALSNLLPAAPLDGGNMLKSALLHYLSETTASRTMAVIGFALGGGALVIGALLLVRGEFSQLLLLGPFLMLGARREGKTPFLALSRPAQKRAALSGGMSGRVFVAALDMSASDAVRELSPGAFNVIKLVDDSLGLAGELGEAELVSGLVELGHGATLGDVYSRVCQRRGAVL